ncbi:unannotated protein [freshwater metagenome]|uniref:Unannotated protein n=1 Tax=freshwater metagenome TaxID=449393 RepID=A0A6J6QTV6_9ZZZZ
MLAAVTGLTDQVQAAGPELDVLLDLFSTLGIDATNPTAAAANFNQVLGPILGALGGGAGNPILDGLTAVLDGGGLTDLLDQIFGGLLGGILG